MKVLTQTLSPQVDYLLSPQAVRERCHQILALAEAGQAAHFIYHPEKLSALADYVLQVIRQYYPNLDIPYHSRWRHFEVAGLDRVAQLKESWADIGVSAEEQGRRLYELGITSVLLDAGAGPNWRYHEARTKTTHTRSEGLAIASFDLFLAGAFSSDASQPQQADGLGLSQFGPSRLAEGFQVSQANPLLGLEGRSQLLQKLGQIVLKQPTVFGETQARLGNLFDYFLNLATDNTLSAVDILKSILRIFGPIWPGRVQLDGVNLGDCWVYAPFSPPIPPKGGDEIPPFGGLGGPPNLIPFHKLSQWLTYSLLEPLQDFGLTIVDVDKLTGLAEYRNGGLLLDRGLLSLRQTELAEQSHAVDSTLIVEWRALTVALLDKLAEHIRAELGFSPSDFPLAKVLQGGTWTAGRQAALTLRPDGRPPLNIQSDGTVF